MNDRVDRLDAEAIAMPPGPTLDHLVQERLRSFVTTLPSRPPPYSTDAAAAEDIVRMLEGLGLLATWELTSEAKTGVDKVIDVVLKSAHDPHRVLYQNVRFTWDLIPLNLRPPAGLAAATLDPETTRFLKRQSQASWSAVGRTWSHALCLALLKTPRDVPGSE